MGAGRPEEGAEVGGRREEVWQAMRRRAQAPPPTAAAGLRPNGSHFAQTAPGERGISSLVPRAASGGLSRPRLRRRTPCRPPLRARCRAAQAYQDRAVPATPSPPRQAAQLGVGRGRRQPTRPPRRRRPHLPPPASTHHHLAQRTIPPATAGAPTSPPDACSSASRICSLMAVRPAGLWATNTALLRELPPISRSASKYWVWVGVGVGVGVGWGWGWGWGWGCGAWGWS